MQKRTAQGGKICYTITGSEFSVSSTSCCVSSLCYDGGRQPQGGNSDKTGSDWTAEGSLVAFSITRFITYLRLLDDPRTTHDRHLSEDPSSILPPYYTNYYSS